MFFRSRGSKTAEQELTEDRSTEELIEELSPSREQQRAPGRRD